MEWRDGEGCCRFSDPARDRHTCQQPEGQQHRRHEPARRSPHHERPAEVEPGRAPDQRQRHEPGLELRQPRREEPQVLNEQHRVDRHVEQRIGPGEPAVPEPPEAAERPLDPLVVATLDGQHRGQLPDEQRFGNTVDEWRRDQQQQRDPGAHRADQPLQTERPARHGEEHHRHERPEAEGGPAAGHWCMWSCSAPPPPPPPPITAGSSLPKAMTCTMGGDLTGMMFDVAVVGAGPPGATAPLTPARPRPSPPLLERDALPRYKTCGGGLVGRALALLPPEVERVLERRCGQADLHLLDVNQHYRATRDPPSAPIMAMTMRERLDHMVASAAAAAGAALRAPCAVTGVTLEPSHVRLDTNTGPRSEEH